MATIHCKLPNGIQLEMGEKSITLNGVNNAAIIGADYGTTEVDDAFYAEWAKANKEFAPLKSGAIFAAKTADAKAKSKDQPKTGLEPIEPASAPVKPVTAD
jgi:hypothetical protein